MSLLYQIRAAEVDNAKLVGGGGVVASCVKIVSISTAPSFLIPIAHLPARLALTVERPAITFGRFRPLAASSLLRQWRLRQLQRLEKFGIVDAHWRALYQKERDSFHSPWALKLSRSLPSVTDWRAKSPVRFGRCCQDTLRGPVCEPHVALRFCGVVLLLLRRASPRCHRFGVDPSVKV